MDKQTILKAEAERDKIIDEVCKIVDAKVDTTQYTVEYIYFEEDAIRVNIQYYVYRNTDRECHKITWDELNDYFDKRNKEIFNV